MSQYFLDGHDLSNLFEGDPISFKEDPCDNVPERGSIIYSIWNKDNEFIYVGISGLQKSVDERNPLSRIEAHRSGRRSGNQFCIYVHDFYIIPKIFIEQKYIYEKGALDSRTGKFIRENFFYRFVSFQQANSDKIVRVLETKVKAGAMGIFPVLNGSDHKLTKQMALPV